MGIKIQHFEIEGASDDGVRKRRKVVPSPELGSVGKTISTYKQGAFESESRRKFRDTEKSFQPSLKPEILKLCKILKFSQDAEGLAEEFLEYVLNNHHVGTESKTTLEAFQISLCWSVASMLKQKIDHKESVALARQQLNFKCSKDEAEFVHSVLRCLKGLFLYRTGKLKVAQSGLALETKLAQDGVSKSIKEIHKKFQKKLNKLIQKQQEEKDRIVHGFEEGKARIEEKKGMEIAVIHSCLENNTSMRVSKLKLVDISFSNELEELEKQMDTCLKKLEVEHLAARRSIRDREAHWVDAVESWQARDELLGKRRLSEPDDYVAEVTLRSPQINTSNDDVIAPVNVNPPSSDDYAGEVILTSHHTNGSNDGVVAPVNVNPPSSEEEMCNGLTVNVSEKEVQLRAPEIRDSDDGLAKLVSGDGPLLEEQIPDTTALTVSGEVQLGVLETIGYTDGRENLVLGSGPLLEEEIPETAAVSLPINEMQPRVPENVSSGDGDTNGSVTQMSLAEKIPYTATLNVAGGEDTLTVPETSCDDVEVSQTSEKNDETRTAMSNGTTGMGQQDRVDIAINENSWVNEYSWLQEVCQMVEVGQTSEENDETRTAMSSGTTGMNQQDRVDNAVNENSWLKELSQVNASSLQPAVVMTNGDTVSANQAREDECTLPSISRGMQPGDVPPCSEQNATEGVGHFVSQPAETTPCNQADLDGMVSEPAAQVHLLTTSNSPSSFNAFNVPLVGQVANLPSSDGCTLNPATELVANSPPTFNQSVLQPWTSSLNQTIEVLIGALGMHFPGLRTSVASEFNIRPAQTVPSVPLVPPPQCADVFQKELDRLSKEFDKSCKDFEDKKLHLQNECDKEIAQVCQKYEIKQQEVDAESLTKKKEFDDNHKKVCMNVILADAFMSAYKEFMPAGRSGAQQDVNATFTQHLNQPSIQQNAQRPSPVASMPPASSPAASLQTLAPEPNPQVTPPATVNIPRTTSLMLDVSPAASLPLKPIQQTTAPAPIIRPHTTPPLLVHDVSPPSSLFTSAFARPPLIGSVSYSTGNRQGGAQIRARPPHLRCSAPTTSRPPHQHRMSTLPTNATAPQSNTLPCLPPGFPSSTHQSFSCVGTLRPETSRGLPSLPNIFSVQELLRNVDRPHAASPTVADCVPNPGQLNTSEFGTSSVPVNPVCTSGPTALVYLSDDDSP